MVEHPAAAKEFRGEEDFLRWRRCGLTGFGFDLGDGEGLIAHLVGVLETIWKKKREREREKLKLGKREDEKCLILKRFLRC